MSVSPKQFGGTSDRIEQGKMDALARRAALSPEQGAKLEAFEKSIPDMLNRFFVGPDNGKGRQQGYLATPEEYDEWKAANP